MLHAFADRENIRVAGAHVVEHLDAAIHLQAGGARQVDVRPDADGEHHQVGRNRPPIRELHALGVVGAENFLGLAVGEEGDAAAVEIALQQLARRRIELALHQRRHQVHERNRHALLLEPPGGFQPQQPAADHDRALVDACGFQHLAYVGDVAKRADAGQAEARNWRRQRPRARSEQQAIIRKRATARRRDGLRAAIDARNRVAGIKPDAVVVVPVLRIDDDVVEALVARQHAGEHDAVVVHMRLGAEHGDAIAVRLVTGQQFLDRAHAGHAVADDDEMFSRVCDHVHGRPP